jgi:beta-N-acetylhexosaminidase
MYPIILGISGRNLTDEERDLFRAFPPFGFILFRRNIWDPEQVKDLIAELREVSGRENVSILVDQEGAKVQKLRPPHWLDLPPMRQIGDLFKKDALKGLLALQTDAQIIAGQFNELGINTICAPVVDVPVPGAHDVIGERAFAEDADTVVTLATNMAKEYLKNGITPVIKHIPGHGRAETDSHYDCPVVTTDLKTLNETDFKAFKQVAQNVGNEKLWAMTAHVVFKALDDKIATLSKKTIDYIRSEMGIAGPIIADTIEMNALGGTLAERAIACLDAGCDAFLYCTGEMEENKKILSVLPKMSSDAIKRFELADQARGEKTTIDWRPKYDELKNLLGVETIKGYKAKEDITEALAASA